MSAFQKSGMRAAAAFACCAALTSAAVAATTIDGDHVFAASETLTDDVTVTGVATFAEGATVDSKYV